MRRLFPMVVMLVVAGCATQPSQSRVFDVFFDSNSASLSPDAHGIVGQIASAARSDRPARIVVDGHAIGGKPGDAKIANERADAVVQALIAQSVDPSTIEKQATLVKPATPLVADRVAGQKVQIELLPYGTIAQRQGRMAAQSAAAQQAMR